MKRKSFTNYDDELEPELKYFDCSGSSAVGATTDWTGTEIPCSAYLESNGVTLNVYTDCALIPSANGPGYGQVLGGKYQILKICVRGIISVDSIPVTDDGLGSGHQSRVALVMDEKAGGAQLQGEQVFTDMGTVTNCIHSFPQEGQATHQFRVIKDVINQHNIAGTASPFDENIFHYSMEAKKFSFTYIPDEPLVVSVSIVPSTPNVNYLKDINLFLLARASSAGHISFVSRCYYVDP